MTDLHLAELQKGGARHREQGFRAGRVWQAETGRGRGSRPQRCGRGRGACPFAPGPTVVPHAALDLTSTQQTRGAHAESGVQNPGAHLARHPHRARGPQTGPASRRAQRPGLGVGAGLGPVPTALHFVTGSACGCGPVGCGAGA